MSTLAPWAEASYSTQVRVPAFSIDDLYQRGKLPAPSMIKLDVEGDEDKVLQGMSALLVEGNLRAVVFEGSMPGGGASGKLLGTHGFDVSVLRRREPSHNGLENFLAVRR